MMRINRVPSDSGLRKFLDLIDPEWIRPVFAQLFQILQRIKVLQRFAWLRGYYLVSIDGTGFFSSDKIKCSHCCTREHDKGTITYGHSASTGTDYQGGRREKNDCEGNVIKRLMARLRREHPRLKIILLADSFHSNASVIKHLIAKKMSFILAAKPGNHEYLFKQFYALDETGQKSP